MYPIWYDAALKASFNEALLGNAMIGFRLEFMMPNWADPTNWTNPAIRETVVKSVGVAQANVIEGQVSIEATMTAPTRQLDLTFLDVNNEYDLGSLDGNTYLSPEKMIKVWYRVHVPAATQYGSWMEVPIFSGHIATIEKEGQTVTLSALSKDARYLEPCVFSPTLGQNKQLWKGLRVTDAIRYILGVHGEQMYRMPAYGNRLQSNLLIKWNDVPWAVCQKIAQAANMHLFFDGYGDCVLERYKSKGADIEINGDWMVEWPQRKLDFTEIRNVVVFKGAKGVRAVARNQRNPLDYQYIKQWKVEIMENSNVKRKDVAQRIANAELKKKQTTANSIGCTTLVLPQLEEYDTIRVRDPIKYGLPGWPNGGSVNIFQMGKATIPLDYKTPMTINRDYPFSYKLKRKD